MAEALEAEGGGGKRGVGNRFTGSPLLIPFVGEVKTIQLFPPSLWRPKETLIPGLAVYS